MTQFAGNLFVANEPLRLHVGAALGCVHVADTFNVAFSQKTPHHRQLYGPSKGHVPSGRDTS
jgi:hypothetical protein